MKLSNITKIVHKQLPTILTGLAVGGVIGTVVLAVRATPKAIMLAEEHHKKLYDERDREFENYSLEEFSGVSDDHPWYLRTTKMAKLDLVKIAWRPYLPAVGMGLVTLACIIGANSINHKRNAALVSAAAISELALKEYQDKVVETLGEKSDRKVRDEIAKSRILDNSAPTSKELMIVDNNDMLCYDAYSGRYFKGNIEEIRRGVNELNRIMMCGERVSLNDFFYQLGLKPTKFGDEVGWAFDYGRPLMELDFSSTLTDDGRPCLVVGYRNPPTVNF